MIDYGPASSADLDQIRDLLRACDLPTEDVTAALLSHFLVARTPERLIGCVGLEPTGGRAALLRSLAVAPHHRGLGVAARLCDEIEEQARADNVSELYLLTTTASDYFATRGYCRVDGGALPESVRATAEFRQLCPATAVAMKKDLAPWPSRPLLRP